MLVPLDNLSDEAAANRFAGAFLVPEEAVRFEIREPRAGAQQLRAAHCSSINTA